MSGYLSIDVFMHELNPARNRVATTTITTETTTTTTSQQQQHQQEQRQLQQ